MVSLGEDRAFGVTLQLETEILTTLLDKIFDRRQQTLADLVSGLSRTIAN